MLSKVLVLVLLLCSFILLLLHITTDNNIGRDLQVFIGSDDVRTSTLVSHRSIKQKRILEAINNINLNKKAQLERGLKKAITALNYEFKYATFDREGNNTDTTTSTLAGDEVLERTFRQILIATSYRSGSSFLGELLNHYPGTFYYFEPLHYYSRLRDRSSVQNETTFFNSLLSCNFNKDNRGFLSHVSNPSNSFLFKRHNFRMWDSCQHFKPKEKLCFSEEYLNLVCPIFPIKLIKTVRMRVKLTEEILTNSPNLRIIVLVRDPRAVFNSKRAEKISSWCIQEHCSDPAVSCQDLLDDVTAARELSRIFPGRVKLLRYEDLSLDPTKTVRRLLEFLDLQWNDSIAQYIKTHTINNVMKRERNKETNKVTLVHDPYGTSRNSTAAVFAWTQSLSFSDVRQIQEVCKEPMEKLGYKTVSSELEMLELNNLLEILED